MGFVTGSTRQLIGVAICILSFGYLVPFGVALIRNKRNKLSIFALNLLLGWTLGGWVIALVWGLSARGD